jgi:predicted DCC family thiol-disulfide oxidoreductase YuxK
MQPELTVWYNTKCPVCDAGIGRQRRRLVEAAKNGAIAFRDINLEPGPSPASAPGSRTSAAGCMRSMRRGGSMSGSIARSRSGGARQAIAGWPR